MKIYGISIGLLVCFLALLDATASRADWVTLPTSYQQLYETYGLYIDKQNMLTYYGNAQVWAAVGGVLPVYGDPDSPSHPMITIIGTGNFGLYYTPNYRFYTQNIDARVGVGYEQAIDEQNRFEINIIHISGHVADGVQPSTVDIVSPGVGSENFEFRFIHDFGKFARLGGAFRPYLRSDPAMNTWENFIAFGELFPWGTSDPHHITPYVATGFELWGPTNNVVPTFHAQAGIYWGNHMEKTHSGSLRTVVGYYGGADPRIKYFSLLGSTVTFYYLGMMFDL
jgi:hypothetical protein